MFDFEGKSIFFIGDSITADGLFLQYLRMHFEKTGHRIFLHNKGIPGGSTTIVGRALEEEISDFLPDYAVIALGVNDMWYWEYDANPEVTEEWKARREELKCTYMQGLALLVTRLREMGITPILCSPFCVNPFMVGEGEIETVVDSKEKSAIANQFYHSVTFAKINKTLGELSALIAAYATEQNLTFWNMFQGTFDAATEDSFISDGIHYSEKGNALLASLFLKNMLGEELMLQPLDDCRRELAAREFDERAYYFIKYNILGRKGMGLTGIELLDAVRAWLLQNGNTSGLTKKREESFFGYAHAHKERQLSLIKDIRGEA